MIDLRSRTSIVTEYAYRYNHLLPPPSGREVAGRAYLGNAYDMAI